MLDSTLTALLSAFFLGAAFLATPFLPWNSAVTPSVERITETPTKRVLLSPAYSRASQLPA